MSGELLSADDVSDVVGAFRLSAAVVAMADLGVPDALAGGPLTAAALAASLRVDAGLLDRLLKMLVARAVLGVDDAGRYFNSAMSEALTSCAVRDMVLGWSALPSVFSAWGHLSESVRSGTPPFLIAHGTDLHGVFHNSPDEAARYATAMASTVEGFEDLAAALDLAGRDTVVSVGGGRGVELVPVLRRWPHVRGVLVDLPDALTGAHETLHEHGIEDRVGILAADATTAVPAGDAFVLSTVLRCLSHTDAVSMLRACRTAATGPHATLNAVEMILPDGPPTHPAATADLTAWVAYGGADHTPDEWRALFAEGGWRLDRIVALTDPYSLLVCTPAAIT